MSQTVLAMATPEAINMTANNNIILRIFSPCYANI